MPQAARQSRESIISTPASPETVWSGDTHGAVGAMHRAIEERLLAGNEMLAVIPAQPRPIEAFIRIASRLVGWSALLAGLVGAALLFA